MFWQNATHVAQINVAFTTTPETRFHSHPWKPNIFPTHHGVNSAGEAAPAHRAPAAAWVHERHVAAPAPAATAASPHARTTHSCISSPIAGEPASRGPSSCRRGPDLVSSRTGADWARMWKPERRALAWRCCARLPGGVVQGRAVPRAPRLRRVFFFSSRRVIVFFFFFLPYEVESAGEALVFYCRLGWWGSLGGEGRVENMSIKFSLVIKSRYPAYTM